MKCLFVILLCWVAQPLSAMTFKEAGENLLYFEHAIQATLYCEQKGFPVRARYDGWYRTNVALFRQSIAKVREESMKHGLTRQEQEQILSEFSQFARKQAKDQIKRKSVPCEKFSKVIDLYSDLLKK